MDIVIADYTSAAVNHVLNIVKYGSAAVLSDDMKDVIEAGKLFFDVDLSSGNEQELSCKKYVSSGNRDELIFIISKSSFNETIVPSADEKELLDLDMNETDMQ